MLTRDQANALLQRIRNGETLSRSELDGLQAFLRSELTAVSTRLSDGTASDADVQAVDPLTAELGETRVALAALPPEQTPEQRAAAADAARARIQTALQGAGVPGVVTPDQRSGAEPQSQPQQPQQQRAQLSIGERFATSPEVRSFLDGGGRGNVSVELPDVDVRALIDSTTGGFDGSRTPFVGTIDPNPDRQLRIADLIDRQTTGENSVPYLIETPNNGAAAEVAEGAQKPEATFDFDEDVAPVRTVAHWVPITRQAAEDNATLVGYIQGRLSYGLELRLDGQLLNGNGTSPNIRGILNTSGLGTYTPGAAEARIITVRKAITVAQISEYAPETVVLHPTDWQEVELDTDNNGSFRVTSSVANALAPRLWGLNVVVTTAIAVGSYLVGAFRLGATLWERHGIRLLMSDSHGTNFTANILVLLAEMRAALTVWRPAAFVKGSFVTA